MKSKLTLAQKKLDTDIWIISLISLGAFLVYMAFGKQFMEYVTSDNSLLIRLLLSASIQFALAGFGISIVCVYRKEKFSIFGLVKKNVIISILGTVLCFVPYIIYIVASEQFHGYSPLNIMIIHDILNSKFPINIFGIAVIALVWGFFERFNYVVICEKLNKRYPQNNQWLDIGAITCAIICILIHPFNTSFLGIIEIIVIFISIYGMLFVKKKTECAWGCVFAFCFIWNAV